MLYIIKHITITITITIQTAIIIHNNTTPPQKKLGFPDWVALKTCHGDRVQAQEHAKNSRETARHLEETFLLVVS